MPHQNTTNTYLHKVHLNYVVPTKLAIVAASLRLMAPLDKCCSDLIIVKGRSTRAPAWSLGALAAVACSWDCETPNQQALIHQTQPARQAALLGPNKYRSVRYWLANTPQALWHCNALPVHCRCSGVQGLFTLKVSHQHST